MTKKAHSSIVGLFLLTFTNGKVEWQGKIIGTDGDDVIVQLHSWLHGYASGHAVLIKRSDLYDRTRVQLFWDEELWSEAATEACKRDAA